MKAKVIVTLKEGVLDPQAKAIYHALHSYGFACVKDIKLSKEIMIDLQGDDETKAQSSVQEMCEILLANTVIEDFKIEMVK